jgi:hypothetical protein
MAPAMQTSCLFFLEEKLPMLYGAGNLNKNFLFSIMNKDQWSSQILD